METRVLKHKKRLLRVGIILGVVIVILAAIELIGYIHSQKLMETIRGYEPIGTTYEAFMDEETGYWTFEAGEDFNVLQLTDLHVGGGLFSIREDYLAVEAVYSLIKKTKPDLVILTGDLIYPVPVVSGTINNMRSAKIIGTLMEQCDVNWALVFGNHDYEAFTLYNQKAISALFLDDQWTKCLYEAGDSDVDGYGNYAINIQDTDGVITHTMYLLDSHAYVAGSFLGLDQQYDNIHQNQVNWYAQEVERLDNVNAARGGEAIPSSMFFHIPLPEYLDAWTEYTQGNMDTDDVIYDFGFAKEPDPIVFCGVGEDNMFEQILETNHTSSVFVGHDHLNTFSLIYKGIRLTYGMSIDYIAYPGIDQKTEQRGGTRIIILPDGDIEIEQIKLSDQ